MSKQAEKLQKQISEANQRMESLPEWIKANCKFQGNVRVDSVKSRRIRQSQQESNEACMT